MYNRKNTVNSEILARILLLRIVLKDILTTLKIRDYAMIYHRVISPFRKGSVFTKLCKFSNLQ